VWLWLAVSLVILRKPLEYRSRKKQLIDIETPSLPAPEFTEVA